MGDEAESWREGGREGEEGGREGEEGGREGGSEGGENYVRERVREGGRE